MPLSSGRLRGWYGVGVVVGTQIVGVQMYTVFYVRARVSGDECMCNILFSLNDQSTLATVYTAADLNTSKYELLHPCNKHMKS